MTALTASNNTASNITGTLCKSNLNDCQAITLVVSEPLNQLASVYTGVFAQSWGLAFGSVIFFYLLSFSIGQIFKVIR